MSKPFTVQIDDTLSKCLENPPSSVDVHIVEQALEPSIFLLSSVIGKIVEERDDWKNRHQELSELYMNLNAKHNELCLKYSQLLDDYKELNNASSKLLNTINKI